LAKSNSDYQFDLHVPAQFTEQRPAFIYRTSEWDGSIDDHPVATRIPRMTNSTSVHSVRDNLAPLIGTADFPKTADDWIYSDYPGFFFQQINFHDATLLMTLFPHHLMDATGYGIFLDAWAAVLHGRINDIPPSCSYSNDLDPCNTLAEKVPPERYIWHRHLMSRFNSLVYTARTIWDNLAKKEDRVVCIPSWFVEQIRADALKALSTSQESAFVSESDVLVAWFSHLLLSAVNPSPSRSLMLVNAVDIRSTVLDDHPGTAYLMNLIFMSHTVLPISEVLSQPISHLASKIRAALISDRTAEQIQARIAWSKEVGRHPLIGPSDNFTCFITNWAKASLFSLDFSPAIVGERSSATPCTPSALLSYNEVQRITPSCCVVLGKNAESNWWMQWYLPKTAWKNVEKHLHPTSQGRCRKGL
jgi:hypothetical protein